MVQTISLQVHLAHDDEADVWYVAASDIPGLVLESDTVEQLIARIKEAAPQMIELNCDEILARQTPSLFQQDALPTVKPSLSWKPVFDSGFALA